LGELVLIRGLPGSGKTTLAGSYAGYRHFEADQFFCRDDAYRFDETLLDEAHRTCFENTRNALCRGDNAVVSNTFTRRNEIEPYFALGYPTRVVEARGRFTSVHGVSSEVMARLARQWEVWPAPSGHVRPVEPQMDAVAMWEAIVASVSSVAEIGTFDYAPLAPVQERARLMPSEMAAVEEARSASLRGDVSFWDAVMWNGLRRHGLSDMFLDSVTMPHPPTIEAAPMTREDVVDGRLRGRVQSTPLDRVLAIVSSVRTGVGGVAHFPMLDLRCPAGPEGDAVAGRVASRLLKQGGIVLRSGRSYHVVGRTPVSADALRGFLAQSLFYAPIVDRNYVAHHLLRGQCTLRISASPTEPAPPVVVTTF
jgi:hypothetical protein